jgi:hypothetical protein
VIADHLGRPFTTVMMMSDDDDVKAAGFAAFSCIFLPFSALF